VRPHDCAYRRTAAHPRPTLARATSIAIRLATALGAHEPLAAP
jgi:hypothetical protein